jgi:hypothetical protein
MHSKASMLLRGIIASLRPGDPMRSSLEVVLDHVLLNESHCAELTADAEKMAATLKSLRVDLNIAEDRLARAKQAPASR